VSKYVICSSIIILVINDNQKLQQFNFIVLFLQNMNYKVGPDYKVYGFNTNFKPDYKCFWGYQKCL